MSEHTAIQELSHAQYLAAKGVSASMLKVIRESTPLHLWWQMQNPPEPTPAQEFGTLVHAAILTPDSLLFHVKPRDLDMRTKAGKEWAATHQDKPAVSADDAASIDAMKTAVHRHKTASRLLKNAEYERSLFVNDSHGTLRKLRPDVLPKAGNILPDLKTCESAADEDFARSIATYGYFCQAAYYIDGCKLAGREFEMFAFIAVEKRPPYAVAVYTLDDTALSLGRSLYQRDLTIYRECLASNHWPGYSEDPMWIGLPPWMQKEAEKVA